MSVSDLVSVVIPTWNAGNRLIRTVKSVLNQTYINLEVIVVDDFSDEKFQDVLSQCSELDPRVKVVKAADFGLAGNAGPGVCRNIGIELSNGRFIAFCDSDDVWRPEKISTQVGLMSEERIAFSFCSYRRLEDKTGRVLNEVHAKPEVRHSDLLFSNWIGCSTVVYDVDLLGKRYMPSIRRRQDYGAWLDVTRTGVVAHGISRCMVDYYVRADSLSRNRLKGLLFHLVVLKNHGGVPFVFLPLLAASYLMFALLKRRR